MRTPLWGCAALAGCGRRHDRAAATFRSSSISRTRCSIRRATRPSSCALHERDTAILERQRPRRQRRRSISATSMSMTGVTLDAVLRTDTGEAVGYGRVVDADGSRRRRDDRRAGAPADRLLRGSRQHRPDSNPNTNDTHWSTVQPTFSDLSTGIDLDGSNGSARHAVLMVVGGPVAVHGASGDERSERHAHGRRDDRARVDGRSLDLRAAAGDAAGGVIDGAGTDDGKLLLIGTTTHLFVVDTDDAAWRSRSPTATSAASRSSSRRSALSALAVKNRASTTGAAATAELFWIAVNADDTNQVMPLGTGGFTDVAGDRGRAFYVDSCKGELGEATASGVSTKRTTASAGRPRSRCRAARRGSASRSRATPRAGRRSSPRRSSGSDPPRTLFDEPGRQVVDATSTIPACSAQLDAADRGRSITLEVGAGGDYVAATLAATYTGDAIADGELPADGHRAPRSCACSTRRRRRRSSAIAAGATARSSSRSATSPTGRARPRPARPRRPTRTTSTSYQLDDVPVRQEMTCALALLVLCALAHVARAEDNPQAQGRRPRVPRGLVGAHRHRHAVVATDIASRRRSSCSDRNRRATVYGEQLDQAIVKCGGEADCVAKIGAEGRRRRGHPRRRQRARRRDPDDAAHRRRTHTVIARIADSLGGDAAPTTTSSRLPDHACCRRATSCASASIDISSNEAGAPVTVGGEQRGITPIAAAQAARAGDLRDPRREVGLRAVHDERAAAARRRAQGRRRARRGAARYAAGTSTGTCSPGRRSSSRARPAATIYFATQQTTATGPLKGVGVDPVVRPRSHHERVLVVVLVVARAHVHGPEPGALVERDRRAVAARAPRASRACSRRAARASSTCSSICAADAAAAKIGLRRDREDVQLRSCTSQ